MKNSFACPLFIIMGIGVCAGRNDVVIIIGPEDWPINWFMFEDVLYVKGIGAGNGAKVLCKIEFSP